MCHRSGEGLKDGLEAERRTRSPRERPARQPTMLPRSRGGRRAHCLDMTPRNLGTGKAALCQVAPGGAPAIQQDTQEIQGSARLPTNKPQGAKDPAITRLLDGPAYQHVRQLP